MLFCIKERVGVVMKAVMLLVLPLISGTVLAKPGIDWLSVHWPPFRIADGAEKGQGHVDQMQQMLMAELPQYRHQVHYSNFARVEQALAAPTAQTCIFSLLYNETRAKTMRYSIPAVISVNVMLHVRAEHPLARQWQTGAGVALAEVTADPAINGMVERNRGYPAIVKQYLDVADSNLSSQSLQNINPVDLLLANRFDYLIEFPDRVRYFQSIAPQKSQLVDLPIRGLDPLMVSYAACQDSAEGELRLRDINRALQKLRSTKAYQTSMMQWLSPHRQLQLQKYLPQFISDVNSPKSSK
jgi:uncharacterized protein (TIGR02285 family)